MIAINQLRWSSAQSRVAQPHRLASGGTHDHADIFGSHSGARPRILHS
jgi:hypothetical protein